MTTSKSQIFVVDDHALVRLGMRQLLNGEPDLHVCGEAEDLRGALEGSPGALVSVTKESQ